MGATESKSSLFGADQKKTPPPPPPPEGHDGVWPSRSLPCVTQEEQLAVLTVLDQLAHDDQLQETLHCFVARHCELFTDGRDEQALVCTQIHTDYKVTVNTPAPSLSPLSHPRAYLACCHNLA